MRFSGKLIFQTTVSIIVIALASAFLAYPAVVITCMLMDSRLKNEGQSRLMSYWFKAAAPRYSAWADSFLESRYAAGLKHYDVAPTEWPMFGSVFWLVTADDLHSRRQVDARSGKLREAVEKAAQIVADPVTGTWVKTKWGDSYLEKENVFYRMLLILGLSSYEKITDDRKYHALMSQQRESLAAELDQAPYCLKNDYPSECYPNDVLWAVAAIQRASSLDNTNHVSLAGKLMKVLDGPVLANEGLPGFQAVAKTGALLQGARGCGNSGILSFAAELDPLIAVKWYKAYENRFWKDTGLVAGFTELPVGTQGNFTDVDSGPVMFEFGSVASAFGIGAARSVGRFDHAASLTMQAVACSWPTPAGFLIPGIMGKAAVDSWSLGEVALLFSMTRPVCVTDTVSFGGPVPYLVWLLFLVYAGSAFFLIWREIRNIIRLFKSC